MQMGDAGLWVEDLGLNSASVPNQLVFWGTLSTSSLRSQLQNADTISPSPD